MKTLPDHRAADVDSLSDLGLFNLPWAASRMLISVAVIEHGETELLRVLSFTVTVKL